MFHSAESRWFYEGPLPADALAWFSPGRTLPAAARTDRYLLFPGCTTASVKVREGRFEVKILRGRPEVARYAPGVSGLADCWVKWSYDGEAAAPLVEALLAEDEGWIDVAKARYLLKFSLDEGAPLEVSPEEMPGEGGNVELTRITALGGEWWSFALEAFGHPEKVRDNLRRVARPFFAAHPPPIPLDTADSASYPAWLAGLAEL